MILMITHLLAFLAGVVTCYLFVRHTCTACEVDGHPAIEFFHEEAAMPDVRTHSRRSGLLLLALGVMLMVIGVQAYVGVSESQERADENAARDRADRVYADCLTEFAGDLVTTIRTRVAASATVVEAQKARDRAEQERDEAVDEVIRIVVRARQIPPKATGEELDAALAEVVRARGRLDALRKQEARVLRAEEQVQQENQYQMPKAVCMR